MQPSTKVFSWSPFNTLLYQMCKCVVYFDCPTFSNLELIFVFTKLSFSKTQLLTTVTKFKRNYKRTKSQNYLLLYS